MKLLRAWIDRFFSPGSLAILAIAIVCSVIVVLLPVRASKGIPMWVFAEAHYDSYQLPLKEWNRTHPVRQQFDIQWLNSVALEQRMLAGFLAGTPVADVVEAERGMAAKAFLGPIKDVGFVDLTSRLHHEGIYEQINTPSFSPYTSRGHIFGIPHDVHPVLLAYNAELVEAAGIDVSKIETWDDYFRVLRPLMKDDDGDGRPDHYLLSAWDTRSDTVAILILEAGGSFFDPQDRPTLNRPINASVLARIVTWVAGPHRVCADVASNASGYIQMQRGYVIGVMMPDWMAGQWKIENPRMGGKMKLMPLPAWEKGGRRTSVLGGTMVGITKTSRHIHTAWNFVKYLYLSRDQAEFMFRKTNIISPVKKLWTHSFYDEPDPYFCGQPSGRLYINEAPYVPVRSSSPYMSTALQNVTSALMQLRAYADEHQIYDQDKLVVQAQELLDVEQSRLVTLISRNRFLSTP